LAADIFVDINPEELRLFDLLTIATSIIKLFLKQKLHIYPDFSCH
jgi:hypothetical protein